MKVLLLLHAGTGYLYSMTSSSNTVLITSVIEVMNKIECSYNLKDVQFLFYFRSTLLEEFLELRHDWLEKIYIRFYNVLKVLICIYYLSITCHS